MGSNKAMLIAGLGLVLCFAGCVCAQQSAEPDNPVLLHRAPGKLERPTPPAEGRVRLDVVVTDAAGKPVTGLAAQDFTLLEDNNPQKIISFHAHDGIKAKPDPPVQVILVFDTVNNGFTDIGLIRQGMGQFLRQDGGHLAQPVSLDELTVTGLQKLSAPTTDGNALAAILDKIKPSILPQGVYTFPVSALTLGHIAEDETRVPGRKMLVWPGPGWQTSGPNQNKTVFTQMDEHDRLADFNLMVLLSTEMLEARITLYGGYVNGGYYLREFLKGARKDTDFDPRGMSLSALSLKSGGRGGVSYLNGDSDLFDQINSFMGEANAFYTLTFDPPQAEKKDEYHDLKVAVAKPGLIARTKTGYYNEPELSQPAPVQAKQGPSKSIEHVKLFVARTVSVAELEQILKELKHKSDGETAKELSGLKLTERLSNFRLEAWMSTLHGIRARSALTALADASVFLDLPADEIPDQAPPDLTEQRRIVSLAVDYLARTIPRLPNFYATRTTIRFEDTRKDANHPGMEAPTGQPLHEAETSRATVIYRDGKEVVDRVAEKSKGTLGQEKGLVTRGTFGPILSTVMVDASHGEMTFSHWEKGTIGLKAVFGFAVPKDKSHYQVAYQSPAEAFQGYDVDQVSGYHGEMSIDPATGTILRLTVEADPDLGRSIERADVMVEYGPVDIGGRTYTCPVRSVSYSKGRAVIFMEDPNGNGTALGPEITRLNDVKFGEYHVFRGEVRVLTGDEMPLKQ